jgi:glucosamine kinase
MPSILIADSGSTKTTWIIITGEGTSGEVCRTSGINPFLQTGEEIFACLQNEYSLPERPFEAVYFYGAGCANPEKNDKVRKPLASYFDTDRVFVESDLMAAARSLCGTEPGIAAILGTGSNSCFYDGNRIARHVSPLGYILGDEGSGSVIGRKLLSDILKNRLPADITSSFFEKYRLDAATILDHVYRQPFPNRFMAGFTRFIAEHKGRREVYELVKGSFAEFFIRNISQYPEASRMPVNFTGSIGWHFSEILKEAADDTGFKTGIITESPVGGLTEYHKRQVQKSEKPR